MLFCDQKKIPRSYIHYVLSFLEQILQNKILYIIYNSCYSLVDTGNYWNSTCFSRHRTTIIIVEEINMLECIWEKIIIFCVGVIAISIDFVILF